MWGRKTIKNWHNKNSKHLAIHIFFIYFVHMQEKKDKDLAWQLYCLWYLKCLVFFYTLCSPWCLFLLFLFFAGAYELKNKIEKQELLWKQIKNRSGSAETGFAGYIFYFYSLGCIANNGKHKVLYCFVKWKYLIKQCHVYAKLGNFIKFKT